jgi:hypothetical protein
MGSLRKLIGVVAGSLALAVAASSCSSSQDHPPPVGAGAVGGSKSGAGGKATSTAGMTSAGGAMGKGNCGGSVVCRGHTHCAAVGSGPSTCTCDTGYARFDADGKKLTDSRQDVECTVDESCVRVRLLEQDSCRYAYEPAAVGMFFAVDYCAGTAVLPNAIGNPDTAFDVRHDNAVPTETATGESSVTFIKGRPIESFLTLVIDASGSLTTPRGDEHAKDLLEAIEQLRTQIKGLSDLDPPATISILLFGRNVVEFQPFTRNLDEVDAQLKSIEDHPDQATALVNINGSSIHLAVERGIHSVERMQALRHVVSENGVLTSGTVVVLTDGVDKSGIPVPADLIKNTKVNVITVGISGSIDDADLTTLGRDGSFLAPSKADLADTFSEIATRIRNYPKRAYLLGFCSPARQMVHTLQVGIKGVTLGEKATCSYDAGQFLETNLVCNPAYFQKGCEGQQCGNAVLACGACGDDQCCSGRTCHGPSALAGPKPGCGQQDELCAVEGKVCSPVPMSTPTQYQCSPPLAEEKLKCDAQFHCDPATLYCDHPPMNPMGVCAPKVLVNYDPNDPQNRNSMCDNAGDHDGQRCPELNCAQLSGATNEPFYCLRQARAFERCAGPTASAVCEPGTACQKDPASMTDSICTPRRVLGCASPLDSYSGVCDNIRDVGMTKVGTCRSTGACYFSWESKVPTN